MIKYVNILDDYDSECDDERRTEKLEALRISLGAFSLLKQTSSPRHNERKLTKQDCLAEVFGRIPSGLSPDQGSKGKKQTGQSRTERHCLYYLCPFAKPTRIVPRGASMTRMPSQGSFRTTEITTIRHSPRLSRHLWRVVAFTLLLQTLFARTVSGQQERMEVDAMGELHSDIGQDDSEGAPYENRKEDHVQDEEDNPREEYYDYENDCDCEKFVERETENLYLELQDVKDDLYDEIDQLQSELEFVEDDRDHCNDQYLVIAQKHNILLEQVTVQQLQTEQYRVQLEALQLQLKEQEERHKQEQAQYLKPQEVTMEQIIFTIVTWKKRLVQLIQSLYASISEYISNKLSRSA